MPTKKTTKTSKSKDIKDIKDVNYSELFLESIELSEALIKELDNVMTANLPPAQTGKVLGDIVSGFATQVDILKQKQV